jgi:DinB family
MTLRGRGRSIVLPPWAILRHVVNHSSYHRGQVASKLKRFGIEQSATDLLFWGHRAVGGASVSGATQRGLVVVVLGKSERVDSASASGSPGQETAGRAGRGQEVIGSVRSGRLVATWRAGAEDGSTGVADPAGPTQSRRRLSLGRSVSRIPRIDGKFPWRSPVGAPVSPSSCLPN